MAGRIPQSFIDDLLDRLDIVEVIDRRVPLKKSGRNYSACCPFHDEKTPSFSVNQEKQFYYCFGCGAGGNAIGFLMDYERLDFPVAVENLADMAGLEVPKEATALQEQPQQKKNIYTLLEKATQYYQQQLKQHAHKKKAVDYLKLRGLTGEIARDFDIGYAPPGWDNLLNSLGDNDENKQLLINGGLLIEKPEENKLYDRFRDRIMFPIRDNRGRIIAFGGRVLGDDKPKYLNSPETPVFHKGKELYGLYQARKANRQLRRLLIVEGYMDVVALAQHGINWAAATLGTATSTEHLKRVFRQCPEVVFCFDGDDAGRRAAIKAMESALPVMEDGRQARFLFLPQDEDPDSMVREIGANNFIRLVDKAQPLEDYLFTSQAEGLDLDSMDGKARLSKLATPLINLLPSGVFKTLMMNSLAERTGLSKDELGDILAQHQAERTEVMTTAATEQMPGNIKLIKNPIQRQPLPPKTDIVRDVPLYTIGLLLLAPHYGRDAEPLAQPPLTEEPIADTLPALSILNGMIELVTKRPESNTNMLLGNFMEPSQREVILKSLTQVMLFGEFGEKQDPGQEFLDAMNHLKTVKKLSEIDSQVDKLISKDLTELSDEEKLSLKQLLRDKHKH